MERAEGSETLMGMIVVEMASRGKTAVGEAEVVTARVGMKGATMPKVARRATMTAEKVMVAVAGIGKGERNSKWGMRSDGCRMRGEG